MKEKKNYIDNIPKINDMKWDVSEDGIVEYYLPNVGVWTNLITGEKRTLRLLRRTP